jgi:hypothetical protein
VLAFRALTAGWSRVILAKHDIISDGSTINLLVENPGLMLDEGYGG